MSTKFESKKNRKTFSSTDSLRCGAIFFSLSFPFLAVIGHLPGCVVYQGQFAEIIASLQSGNGPFAMYHNVDGSFE